MLKMQASILVICTFPEDEKMYPHLYDVLVNLRNHFDDVIYVGSDSRYHPLFDIDQAQSQLNASTDPQCRIIIQEQITQLEHKYKRIRYELIDTLERVPFKHADRLVLAIDDHAFNCAMEVYPEDTVFWSFDVLGEDCPYRLPDTDCITSLLKENGKLVAKARALIIQDSERKAFLEETLKAQFKSVIYLPVALNDNEFCKRASVARRQQAALTRLRVVQNGHICAPRFSAELVQAFQNWPQYYELHLRGNLSTDVLEKIIQWRRPVSVSDEFYDNSVLSEVFDTFDIGFVGYKDTDMNHRLVINATGQMVAYLRLGIPVICCGSEQLLAFVEKHRIGIAAATPGAITLSQLDFLLDNYEELSANARMVFEHYYDLEQIMEQKVLPQLETLLQKTAEELPLFNTERSAGCGVETANSFYVALWNDPAWSSPYPNTDEEARWTKISQFLNAFCSENAASTKETLRILDVGCGRGWLSCYLDKYGKYSGIEPVPGAVKIANTLFPGRTFLEGTTTDLLKKQEPQFDIIVSTEVVEHVPYNKQADFISEIYALLKNDGVFVLTTPRREIYDYILVRGLKPQPVEDWLTEDQLQALVLAKGFEEYGMDRIFYDASNGHFYLNPTGHEINLYGLIALYQVWAFKKRNIASAAISYQNETDNNPLVSVIVPTYNRPDMLKVAIQSIQDQVFQNYEIIVVNDAGQDVSSVVQAFNSRKIVYLSHEINKGLAATRNTGIRAAKGKYIAYLDDDDIYYPEHIDTLVTFLESNNFKVAYTDANEALQNKIDGKWAVVKKNCTYSLDFDAEAVLVNNFTPVLCVMHQKECFETTGMFDESLRRHEDWDMWIRMSRSFPFAHIKRITCEFTTRDDGLGMREGALPSFLATYRAICSKHEDLVGDNRRIKLAQEEEVHSLICQLYQFMLKKLIAGENADYLTTAGATASQIQSANFLFKALMAVEPEEKRSLLTLSIEADPDNVVARESLCGLASNRDGAEVEYASKTGRPSVSIVIVTYNSKATIAACLQSVAASLSPDDEVVLVDNASRDETVLLCEQMIHGHSQFKSIRNDVNAGFSKATNQGILATGNPLVVLLNPDTIVPARWLDALSRHIENDIGAVGPVSNYVAGLQKMELYQQGPLPSEASIDGIARFFQVWNDRQSIETRLLIGFCMMIRRDVLEKIGYLDDELFLGNDDLDISWRLRLNGYRLKVATDVFVFHYGQISFSSEPDGTTKRLIQESTDHLYRKLVANYAPESVPSPQDLWGIDWFNPSVEVITEAESARQRETSFKKPLTSIIILTWNQLALTQACLASISRHTELPYELIMIDNGSSDGTVTWLCQQAEADRRITIIENADNLGFAAGCNQGIRAAKGSRLVLLNNDTVVTPGWLSGMNELLERYPDAGIIGPMTNSASGIQVVQEVEYTPESLPTWVEAFHQRHRYRIIPQRRIVGFCMLFRRELIEKVGLLDEAFGAGNYEDDDFCLRAELAGFRNMIAGDVFIHHEGGASFSGNNLIRSVENRKNRVKFRQKWDPAGLEESLLRRWLVLHAIEEATVQARRGNIKAAVETLLNKAIRVDSDAPAPYIALMEILIAEGRYDDALEVLPEMPPDADQMLKSELEAICRCARGEESEALRAASNVLGAGRKSPRSTVVLGTLAARQGNLAEAESLFRKAILDDPSSAGAWMSLGMLCWGKNDQAGAWHAFERTVTLNPLYPNALGIYRDLAARVGRTAEAAKLIGEAVQVWPDSRALALAHVEMLVECALAAEALKAGERFLSLFEADDELLRQMVELRRQKPESASAPQLSLCMIVRNEEKTLPRCLASLKPVVDEMIIVDTGSDDRTVDIAEAFGARVFKFPWNGNFSDARNASLDQARGNWILVMDADEVLAEQDYSILKQSLQNKAIRQAAWSVITRNYTNRAECEGWKANDGSYPLQEKGDGWYPSRKVRLFPAAKNIRFKGDIHEMVEADLRAADISIEQAGFVVHHYGELTESDRRTKQLRYYELGRHKLAERPDDTTALLELALQAGELGLFDEALELWDRLLDSGVQTRDVYFNRCYVLMGLKRFNDAADMARKALDLDPGHKESALNLSVCELQSGAWEKAWQRVTALPVQHHSWPLLSALRMALAVIAGDKRVAADCLEQLRLNNYAIVPYLEEMQSSLIESGQPVLAGQLAIWAKEELYVKRT